MSGSKRIPTVCHRRVQELSAWDPATLKTVYVTAFAGLYNPGRYQLELLLQYEKNTDVSANSINGCYSRLHNEKRNLSH
jgi:hypothetical protein